MALTRVRETDVQWLDRQPESAMCLQIVLVRDGPGSWRLVPVVGGRVIVEWTRRDEADGVRLEAWMTAGDPEVRVRAFEAWLGDLPASDIPLDNGSVVPARLAVGPLGPLPQAPAPPAYVYGHLPLSGVSAGDAVFYRWEAFPTSRRVDQKIGTVVPGTYTGPALEAPFVSSGLGAVGRFALPTLLPCSWRWEVRPPAGTWFRCGAGVPLYGQSGGGVEAMFPNGFTNVGPIANPFVLPAL